MIKISRIQLGVWKSRIEHTLEYCAGEIPDGFALSLEITLKEMDHAIRTEQEDWDGVKEEIQKGASISL